MAHFIPCRKTSDAAEFAYNNAVHRSIGGSAFSIVYTKAPQHTLDLIQLPKQADKSVAADHMAKQIVEVHQEVKQRLEEANKKYKAAAEKHRRKHVFVVGDQVMVFLRKERLPAGSYNKLQQKKYEPYTIGRKINNNAHIIDLSCSMGISNTFNVANLSPFHESIDPLYPDPISNSRTSFSQVGENDAECISSA
ncbi:uncharacterized protein LOC125314669 [Rhodamnia argentea]|uniref:Uncharacterized protein LOC125314669 n=1 Tax=Rhodamnia argentea TaxID=178133 RepID=A0ABM3HA72_9MYRT|nr:uncharacterized protein LOC125314669 [Rhodamnia argentea]